MRFALCILLIVSCSVRAATYYVDNGGNNSNSGLPGSPWQTVSNGLAHIAAGDTLTLTSGQTFNETNLWTSATGTQSSPILITTSGAARATLSVAQGCGLLLTNNSWFTVNNLEIVGNVTNRADPNEEPTATNIVGILYAPWNASSSTNFIVQNCAIHLFGTGIHVWNKNTAINYNTTISSNFIYDCKYTGITVIQDQSAGNLTNVSVLYNTVSNILGDYGGAAGIFLVRNRSATVSGNSVTTVKNDPAVSSYPSVGIEFDYNGPCVVRGNEISEVRAVSHSGDAIGLDFDYGSHDMLAEDNYVRDCDGAAFQGYFCTSNNVWRFNVAVNCGVGTGSLGMFNLSNSGASSVISNNAVYNNTFISLSNGAPGIVVGASSTLSGTNLFANNIIITTNAPSFYVPASMANSLLASRNDYYDLGRAVQLYWNGATYTSWGNWTNTTQQEVGTGLTNNPSLNSLAISTNNNVMTIQNITNYRLTAQSPLVAAGLNLNSQFGFTMPATDFSGAVLPGSGYSVGAINGAWPIPWTAATIRAGMMRSAP